MIRHATRESGLGPETGSSTAPAVSLMSRLGFRNAKAPLLRLALVHRSYTFEHGGAGNNERLEFLGDAVLGLVITDWIFRQCPELAEGEMARLRSSTVNMGVLAEVARTIGLGDSILLGRGEELSGGRDKDSILADTLEAVLGAAYLEYGLPKTRQLIDRLFEPHIRRHLDGGVAADFKTDLQERAAQGSGAVPDYEVSSSGPDHQKSFEASVSIAGRHLGSGRGRSKKQAEQAAAREALARLNGSGMAEDARAT